MKLGIRADANSQIAMGHLMRCMAIGQQCKNMGIEVQFFVSEEDGMDLLQQQGFSAICLHHSYQQKEEEIPRILQLCEEKKITHFLIDSYEITQYYLEELKKKMVIAYLDDWNHFFYPVDVLINYSLYAKREEYEKKGDYRDMRLLLGNAYVPLRQEFSGKPILVKQQCRELFLTTGGSDPYHVSMALLEKLAQEPMTREIQKCVIAGPFYKDMEQLQQIAGQFGFIQIYQNVKNMAGMMRRCDLAVSAGGTTLAELCACGVPTIAFTMADNQLAGTKAYAAEDILYYAGDVRNEGFVQRIFEQICLLLENVKQREYMSKRGHQCVDGEGAKRIAEAILSIPCR